jgi:5'-AMP-activated protein kinase catalytic alpha subunit
MSVTIVGDYSVGETLGQGSFGKVKLGTHLKTGQQVALKLIAKSARPPSFVIARVAADMSCPGHGARVGCGARTLR